MIGRIFLGVNSGKRCHELFCSLAVLGPKVGHTVDVLSPVISVLCDSD